LCSQILDGLIEGLEYDKLKGSPTKSDKSSKSDNLTRYNVEAMPTNFNDKSQSKDKEKEKPKEDKPLTIEEYHESLFDKKKDSKDAESKLEKKKPKIVKDTDIQNYL
jgi:hypothetical protein